MRQEQDSLGTKDVPAEALYGIQTSRSLENFSGAGAPLPLPLAHAMARLKWACAEANHESGSLPEEKKEAIIAACRDLTEGTFDEALPIDIFQAGSGTSSNMNVNEVLANAAAERLGGKRGDRSLCHPNDDVNRGQSTNNVFPSAIKVACVLESRDLLASLQRLADALHAKEEEFRDLRKSGRTHLQDAVPVTLGQEFGAYARAVEKSMERVRVALNGIRELGVGGNAVGTGLNTRTDYRERIVHFLNRQLDESFRTAVHGLECTQFLSDLGSLSAALQLYAADLLKICNDLRLMASGPNTGLGEIRLPPVEPGSSIMPGKINPSICEAANMACVQVMGNDHAVQTAVHLGQLELNTHMPVIGANLIHSIGILTRTNEMLTNKCIQGVEADTEVCERNFLHSAGLATVLNPVLGYDRVAQLVKESLKTGKHLKELVEEQGIVPADQLETLLKHATGPRDDSDE